ncbi:unnamed protein product, partial [Urochloa humidicola]
VGHPLGRRCAPQPPAAACPSGPQPPAAARPSVPPVPRGGSGHGHAPRGRIAYTNGRWNELGRDKGIGEHAALDPTDSSLIARAAHVVKQEERGRHDKGNSAARRSGSSATGPCEINAVGGSPEARAPAHPTSTSTLTRCPRGSLHARALAYSSFASSTPGTNLGNYETLQLSYTRPSVSRDVGLTILFSSISSLDSFFFMRSSFKLIPLGH